MGLETLLVSSSVVILNEQRWCDADLQTTARTTRQESFGCDLWQ